MNWFRCTWYLQDKVNLALMFLEYSNCSAQVWHIVYESPPPISGCQHLLLLHWPVSDRQNDAGYFPLLPAAALPGTGQHRPVQMYPLECGETQRQPVTADRWWDGGRDCRERDSRQHGIVSDAQREGRERAQRKESEDSEMNQGIGFQDHLIIKVYIWKNQSYVFYYVATVTYTINILICHNTLV